MSAIAISLPVSGQSAIHHFLPFVPRSMNIPCPIPHPSANKRGPVASSLRVVASVRFCQRHICRPERHLRSARGRLPYPLTLYFRHLDLRSRTPRIAGLAVSRPGNSKCEERRRNEPQTRQTVSPIATMQIMLGLGMAPTRAEACMCHRKQVLVSKDIRCAKRRDCTLDSGSSSEPPNLDQVIGGG